MKFNLSHKRTIAVKWIFTLALLFFLFFKIGQEENKITVQYLVQVFSNPALILTLVLLTFINWFFDTLSWKLISKHNQTLPFSKILSANLISQYLGLLTPFGLGEYRAKMRVFKERQERHQSVVSTISYRWSKAAAKFGVSILAAAYLLVNQMQGQNILLLLGATAVWVIFIIQYKYFLKLGFKLFNLKQKLNISAEDVNIYPTLLPATIKFLSYVLQFALVTTFFQTTPLVEAVAYGTIVYSVASVLPQLSILDPFIKGGVGAFLLPDFPPEIILTATFLVWLLNVGLPSIAGAILWFKPTQQ